MTDPTPPTIVTDLVGKRALLRVKSPGAVAWTPNAGTPTEYRVREVSPSGNWVSLQSQYGQKFWAHVPDVSLVEVLHDPLQPKRPAPPPKLSQEAAGAHNWLFRSLCELRDKVASGPGAITTYSVERVLAAFEAVNKADGAAR